MLSLIRKERMWFRWTFGRWAGPSRIFSWCVTAPTHRSQGEGNNFWIIQDYGNIVVHIFLKEYRDFYRLEDLWADVPRKEYKERKSSAKAKKQQD